jgi:hypothetical protein
MRKLNLIITILNKNYMPIKTGVILIKTFFKNKFFCFVQCAQSAQVFL